MIQHLNGDFETFQANVGIAQDLLKHYPQVLAADIEALQTATAAAAADTDTDASPAREQGKATRKKGRNAG